MRNLYLVVSLGILLQAGTLFSQPSSLKASLPARENRITGITAFHFKHIGEEEGLSQHSILSILQDQQGYLWLGTEEGLVRYDGYRFRTFTHFIDDSASLSNRQVNCLFEDSRGWLWAGTEDDLNYFDPRTETFVRIRTLPERYWKANPNAIFAICEDRDGDIWTANSIGVTRIQFTGNQPAQKNLSGTHLNPGQIRMTHFDPDPESSGSPHNAMFSLLIDRRGTIWAGSELGLMRLLPASAAGPQRHAPGNPPYVFERLYERFGDQAPLLKANILGILEDHSGTIWIKSSHGLARIDPPASPAMPMAQLSHYKSYTYDVQQYRKGAFLEVNGPHGGRFWMSLKEQGFVIFDPRQETFLKIKNDGSGRENSSIPYFIHAAYRDRNGITWFGTASGGLYKYDTYSSRFANYHPKLDDLIYNDIIDMRFIFEDSRGDLWIANEGVYRCDRQSGKVLSAYWTESKVQGWTFKNKIAEDGRGGIWIASEYGGLYRYDPHRREMSPMVGFTPNAEGPIRKSSDGDVEVINANQIATRAAAQHNKTMISENVTALGRDQRGNIWTAAWVNVYRKGDIADEGFFVVSELDVTAQKIRRYRLQKLADAGLSRTQHFIYSIRVETSGRLWLGTSFGLLRFDPPSGDIRLYQADIQNPNGLSSNRVHAISADRHQPQRYLWIGTDGGGLCRFDKEAGTFLRYSSKEGLPGNTVSSVLTDEHGNLWLGTNKGLSHAVVDSESCDILRFSNYDRSAGIIDDDFSFFYGENAYKNAKGEMFFAGAKGVTIFHPDEIRDNPLPPRVVLSRFYLNFQPVDIGDPGSPLTQPLSQLKKIELSHENNSFSMEIAALDFHAPEKNRFAYKLEGYQDDWVYPGSERRATFTLVPPGNYTFRAKAANSDGVWNEDGLSLNITIIPPWYQTRWAYFTFTIVVLGLLYGMRRYEMNRQQHKLRAQLRQTETEQLKELDRIKTRFFTNISHEFRTPLSLIKGPVEQELEQTRSGSTRRRMNMVLRNVNRLFHLINQLLDLGALEANRMELRAAPTDLVSFLHGITMGFASWAERKNISLKIFSKVEEVEVYFDGDLMEKIFNNLLSNAIKFTGEGGRVEVTVQLSDDEKQVEVLVEDNGIGIPPERLPHIFDRFYQGDASTTREFEGSGIGLALVQELVELHHGSISVGSRRGTGTVFKLAFPLGKAHLKPGQIMASVTESRRVKRVSVEESSFVQDEGQSDGMALPAPPASRPLVLVVEDHADFRNFIREILNGDFRVLEAPDGQKGLEIALEKIPDLIISDVMMPHMNGYELCQKIKNDQRTCHIPVVLLTAKAAQEDKLEGLHTGADDYLSKPFDSRELRSRVQNLIAQRRMLQGYYQQHLLLKSGGVPVTSADEIFLQKALELVQEHIEDEQFSVEDLAKGVGMSRSQLHRKIDALTGKSATHFIRAVRLQRAAELLRAGAGNVTEIAYMAGFSSQSYFTRCFAEQFGCSPSEYKQRNP